MSHQPEEKSTRVKSFASLLPFASDFANVRVFGEWEGTGREWDLCSGSTAALIGATSCPSGCLPNHISISCSPRAFLTSFLPPSILHLAFMRPGNTGGYRVPEYFRWMLQDTLHHPTYIQFGIQGCHGRARSFASPFILPFFGSPTHHPLPHT